MRLVSGNDPLDTAGLSEGIQKQKGLANDGAKERKEQNAGAPVFQ